MKLFLPFRKATLLIPSGPKDDPGKMHLFIVLTDPATNEKLVLVASVCSVKEGVPYDQTCILEPSDHPFIKHKSYVDYSKTKIVEGQRLTNGVQQGKFVHKGMISETVVVKIINGVLASKRTPKEEKQFLSDYRNGKL